MKRLLIVLCLLLAAGCTTTMSARNRGHQPFSFGLITDVQYADKESGGARHYRDSLGSLTDCVEELNKRELAFTIQLGDLIDGNSTPEKTLSDLNSVLNVYNTLSMPTYHVIGNHCLVAGEQTLKETLNLRSLHYDFTVPTAQGWRFVVLNGNDEGYGKLGVAQLEWFKSTLAKARARGERAIVFSHFPLTKRTKQKDLMKDPEPVLKLIADSGCVVACFAGHDHRGGYSFQDGVHYITVKGMVEAATDNAYAVIEVHPTEIRETGFGKEPSREMKAPSPSEAEGAVRGNPEHLQN